MLSARLHSVESSEMRAFYEQKLAEGVDLNRFNRRVERLDLLVYKRFGSNNPVGLSTIDCGHENPDGEAHPDGPLRRVSRHR